MSNIQAAGLPITTNSDLWPLRVAGTGERAKYRLKGERGGAQTPALSPDGRPTLSSGCIARFLNQDGDLKSQKTASVHVINATTEDVFEPGEYLADGLVWIQPYIPEGSNRIAYSITVESLVPVTTPAPKKAEA
jgi:hypothetical protein